MCVYTHILEKNASHSVSGATSFVKSFDVSGHLEKASKGWVFHHQGKKIAIEVKNNFLLSLAIDTIHVIK